MQKHVNLVDLVKSFPTNIFLQHLASIQQRTSLTKFDHLDEKSGKGSISNFSTKVGGTTAGTAEKYFWAGSPPAGMPPKAVPQNLIDDMKANVWGDMKDGMVKVNGSFFFVEQRSCGSQMAAAFSPTMALTPKPPSKMIG